MQRGREPKLDVVPVLVIAQRELDLDPLTKESFVVGDQLVLDAADVRDDAGAAKRVGVDPLVGAEQVAPERVGGARRGDVARLDHTAVHEHSRAGSEAAIAGDLEPALIVPVEADEVAGALELSAQLPGDLAEPIAPACSLRVWHVYGTSGSGATFTRPIMFASPPNQIWRVALSNVM